MKTTRLATYIRYDTYDLVWKSRLDKSTERDGLVKAINIDVFNVNGPSDMAYLRESYV